MRRGWRSGIALLAAALLGFGCRGGRTPARGVEAGNRLAWWMRARFGMFVHFGIYAIPAGTWKGRTHRGPSEWLQAYAGIPRKEYAKLARKFDPADFDAESWVRLAKAAGMRYLVITSKHHDGFALWDSAVSDFDLGATPFRRDLLGELARACRKEGLRLGFYYSIMDWHHEAQIVDEAKAAALASAGRNAVSAFSPTRTTRDGKRRYLAFMKVQLRELLDRYDPDLLWFDGEWVPWWTREDGKALLAWLRGLDPSLVVNDRIGKRAGDGDYGTPEQRIPAVGPERPWETCMTTNDSWGFKRGDNRWKSPESLLWALLEIAGKGGNFLLNAGPDARGRIPRPQREILRSIGRWLARHGEGVYGTERGPWRRPRFGQATLSRNPGGTRLHVFVKDWPRKGFLVLEGLRTELRRAWIRAPGGTLPVPWQPIEEDGALSVALRMPAEMPERPITEIVLDCEDPPRVRLPLPAVGSGSLVLPASEAVTTGRIALEQRIPGGNLGFWTRRGDHASWDFRVRSERAFSLHARYAAPPASKGLPWRLEIRRLDEEGREGPLVHESRHLVRSTGSWTHPLSFHLLRLPLPAGDYRLRILPLAPCPQGLFNLASVRLEAAGS